VLAVRILIVDFVVCTLAVEKKNRAGFDLSDRTIPFECHPASYPVHIGGNFLGIILNLTTRLQLALGLRKPVKVPSFPYILVS
jgi:hypothetical protein